MLFFFDLAPGGQVAGLSWFDILMGAIFAFLGALLFVWIGRRFIKRR
ncbi:MAG: hypothetical protein UZ17_ACD001000667 [Acidobacteria bacterium OLB17]|nr:MAG: hypothetical protein UZ17_ACD001000667 [Acidobacteria bacterium OLB17]